MNRSNRSRCSTDGGPIPAFSRTQRLNELGVMPICEASIF
jgi:hypothetical protein